MSGSEVLFGEAMNMMKPSSGVIPFTCTVLLLFVLVKLIPSAGLADRAKLYLALMSFPPFSTVAVVITFSPQ